MSTTFTNYIQRFDWGALSGKISSTSARDVEAALARKGKGGINDLLALLSPQAGESYLDQMASMSNRLTMQRFGKAIRLFAPLYLSNECNNICDYCGFSMHNKIPRKTLTDLEILKEAGILKKWGFDHVLLVTGESSRRVEVSYLSKALDLLRPYFANLSIEVQPLSTEEYTKLIDHGLHAVMVYQETYNQESYQRHHLKGKKTNFDWRLNTADRLGKAGVKKIGLGCLFGLTRDWRTDALFAGIHLDYLEKKFWQTSYSMSFPRIRPYEGNNITAVDLNDRDLVQLYCAFRIFNHEMELTLSTRESPQLRENLLPLGVTTMSAGSKTNPGGYAQAEESLEQFEISDDRQPEEIASMLRLKSYDPVWKDWDASYDCNDSLAKTLDAATSQSLRPRSPQTL
jgi:2-iminoacetate synthase